MEKSPFTLHEYELSKADLDVLTEDQKAFFAVLCFAVSEVNSLLRLITFLNHPEGEDPIVAAAAGMQATLLLRTVSSKLFEFKEFLELSGAYNRTKDSGLLDFREKSKNKFSALESHPGFITAKTIRHEAAFHYKLKPARMRVKSVPEDAMRAMYLHELNGNSFFPFGEETLFVGLINELSKADDADSTSSTMDNLANWCVSAIRVANDVFLEFFVQFIDSKFPTRNACEKQFQIDPTLLGSDQTTTIPVFVRLEQT